MSIGETAVSYTGKVHSCSSTEKIKHMETRANNPLGGRPTQALNKCVYLRSLRNASVSSEACKDMGSLVRDRTKHLVTSRTSSEDQHIRYDRIHDHNTELDQEHS